MAEEKRTVKQTAKGDHITQVAGDLIVKVPEDIQSVFDESAELINKGKAETAQVLLERTWRHHNDAMSHRQKSNCWRLLGCALDRQDKTEEAGKYFLQAKDLDPTWEKARAYESLGYLYVGNPSKARALAESLLQEYSQNTLAWSVWIRAAPSELAFEAVQLKVPPHLLDNAEVAMALGARAASEGSFEAAEQFVAAAQKQVPENPRVTESLGDLMFQRAGIGEQILLRRSPSESEVAFLVKAQELYTRSLKKWHEEGSVSAITRVRLRRAWTYAALSNIENAVADAGEAYEMAPDDPTVAYSYAAFIGDKNLPAAIDALNRVVGKDEKPGVEHLLAQMLLQRNQGKDREAALGLLKGRLSDLCTVPEDSRFDYMALAMQLERELHSIQGALDTLQEVPSDVIGDRLRAVLSCETLWYAGKKEDAIKMSQGLCAGCDEATTFNEKRRIAGLMQMMGLHREALNLWKDVVSPQYIGRDTYSLIDCAQRCQDVCYLITFSERLRANGLWDKQIFDLEVYLRQKFNDWRGCKEVLQEYVRAPLSKSYVPYAKAHLAHVASVLGEVELIETDLSQLPTPWDVDAGMGRLIVQSLRLAGEPVKAVQFAYELVRKHWNSPDAHLAMASFRVPIGPQSLELQSPSIVEPGVAVQYKEERTNTLVWHIVEDSQLGTPDASRNEYPVNHRYSQKMLGLKQGDTFLLRGGQIQERRATIMAVLSKYHFRILDTLEGLEDRFPDNNAILRIDPVLEDGQLDLEPLKRLAEAGNRRGAELLKLYREQPLPVCFLAVQMGKDVFTTLNHLISDPAIEVHCRLGSRAETEAAIGYLEEATEIVIDEMTLATLLFCGVHTHLAKSPKRIIVSEGTLLSIENWEVMRIDPDLEGGSVGLVGGQLTVAPRTREGAKKAQDSVRGLISAVREYCILESGVSLGLLTNEKRETLVAAVGQACAESMALARLGRRVLWTDDVASGALAANEFGARRVWTQLMFEYLGRQGLIDAKTVRGLTLTLTSLGYWFTSLNADAAIMAISEADWKVDSSPLKDVLAHFGDRRVTLDANLILMAAKLLKHSWNNDCLGMKAAAVTLRILGELARRGDPILLANALWVAVERLFSVDVLTARHVKSVFQNWLAPRGGALIVP